MLPVRSFAGVGSAERLAAARPSLATTATSRVFALAQRSIKPNSRVARPYPARRSVLTCAEGGAHDDALPPSLKRDAEASDPPEAAEAVKSALTAVEAEEEAETAVVAQKAPAKETAAEKRAKRVAAERGAASAFLADIEESEQEQIIKLTQTVSTLKMRMKSLAKLLDEAVEQRGVLEDELSAATESAEVAAKENRQKMYELEMLVEQYKTEMMDAKAMAESTAKEVAAAGARMEKQLEARVKAAVKDVRDAKVQAKQNEVDAAAVRVAKLLEDVTEMEQASKEAIEADKNVKLNQALAKMEKELEAARASRDAFEKRANSAEQQLKNQKELLIKVDELVSENGDISNSLQAKDAKIHALNKQVEKLKEKTAMASEAATRNAAALESVEEKFAERVSQTLAAAETCVSTAEKVKKEAERNTREAEELAATQVAAAIKRAEAAEANLARSNESLEKMTEIATQKEATDVQVAKLELEVETKKVEIDQLKTDLRSSAEAAAMWEAKAAKTAALLEKRAREVAEAMENIDLRTVQVKAATQRAELAEGKLRRQTELLDEMAEVAALKEAAEAKVIVLEAEAMAAEQTIETLTAEANANSEAAAMWEGKASAANATADARAKTAEAAAKAREEAAAKKMEVLEQTYADVIGVADKEAVATAVKAELELIHADAEHRVDLATRETESVKRALAAASYSIKVWRERAENLAASIENQEEPRSESNNAVSVDRIGRGRLVASAFASGAELRAFVNSGPRVTVSSSNEDATVKELDAMGMGRPFHGRYDMVDTGASRAKASKPVTNEGDEYNQASHAEGWKLPVMKWDPGEEQRMKERLPFNPRAEGKWGTAKNGDKEDGEDH